MGLAILTISGILLFSAALVLVVAHVVGRELDQHDEPH